MKFIFNLKGSFLEWGGRAVALIGSKAFWQELRIAGSWKVLLSFRPVIIDIVSEEGKSVSSGMKPRPDREENIMILSSRSILMAFSLHQPTLKTRG